MNRLLLISAVFATLLAVLSLPTSGRGTTVVVAPTAAVN
jgi:hypothetical protein